VTGGCKNLYNKELYKLCPSPFTEYTSCTVLVIYTKEAGFDRTAHTNYKNDNKKVNTFCHPQFLSVCETHVHIYHILCNLK